MRTVLCAALLVAAPAAAQPVAPAPATSCQVTIARAPDDVRSVVEKWVQAEAQCNLALEVRIVPTDGGLYLLAQDANGGVRERIVPDAQSAGVLVASWIADDNAPPPPPPPLPAAPVIAPAAVSATESIAPPGLAAVSIAVTAPPARRSKWLNVGAILPMLPASSLGLRAEADVFRMGSWFIGGAVSMSGSEMDLWSQYGYGGLSVVDLRAMAYVTRPMGWGHWQLRPSAGVGLVNTQGSAWDGSTTWQIEGTFPLVEASLILSRDIGSNWAAYTGPLFSVFDQTYMVSASSSSYPMTIQRGAGDITLFTGIRRRL